MKSRGERGVLLSFLAASLALAAAPGPDILFVLAQSVAHGPAAGVCVTLGLCTGLVFHVSLAACGAAAALKRRPRAVAWLELAGAAYLAYLGAEAWRAAGGGAGPEAVAAGPLRLYGRGVAMNLLNPKVSVFFLALMPGFAARMRGSEPLRYVRLGGVFALSVAAVFGAAAWGGGSVAGALRSGGAAALWLNRFSAAVLFALAAWIAAGGLKGLFPRPAKNGPPA